MCAQVHGAEGRLACKGRGDDGSAGRAHKHTPDVHRTGGGAASHRVHCRWCKRCNRYRSGEGMRGMAVPKRGWSGWQNAVGWAPRRYGCVNAQCVSQGLDQRISELIVLGDLLDVGSDEVQKPGRQEVGKATGLSTPAEAAPAGRARQRGGPRAAVAGGAAGPPARC